MSRTPDSDICMVRGMGVADSVSTSMDSRRFFSCSLCCTPKRCSSSMMTQPQVVRVHVAREQPVRAHEHVHVALWRSPRSGSACCCSGVRKRESTSTLHAEGLEAFLEGRVVLLRQNGGRDRAPSTCLPSCVALNAARRATSVLPKPTSPHTQAVHGARRTACRPSRRRWRPAGRGVSLVGEGLLHLALPGRVRPKAVALGRRRGGRRRPPGRRPASWWPCARVLHGPRPVGRVQAREPGAARLPAPRSASRGRAAPRARTACRPRRIPAAGSRAPVPSTSRRTSSLK